MTIDQLEAELARYEALHKTGQLRIPQGDGAGASEHTFEVLAVLKDRMQSASARKNRDAARAEYEKRLPHIVMILRQLNPGK